MPQVRIKTGLSNVTLPNGNTYEGGAVVYLTDEEFAQLASTALGDEVLAVSGYTPVAGDPNFRIWAEPIVLSSIADGALPLSITPGFAGTIVGWQAIATTPASTASKLSTLNLAIGATDVGTTPSTVALTTAALNAAGKVVAGAAVVGANAFDDNDVITVEAASTTAFVEGRILLQVFLKAN